MALPNPLTYTFDSWKKLRCQKKSSLWYLSVLYCAKCLFFCRRKNILFKAIANFPFFCSLLVVFARAAILRLLYEPLLFVPRLNKHLTEHFCIIYRGFPAFLFACKKCYAKKLSGHRPRAYIDSEFYNKKSGQTVLESCN